MGDLNALSHGYNVTAVTFNPIGFNHNRISFNNVAIRSCIPFESRKSTNIAPLSVWTPKFLGMKRRKKSIPRSSSSTTSPADPPVTPPPPPQQSTKTEEVTLYYDFLFCDCVYVVYSLFSSLDLTPRVALVFIRMCRERALICPRFSGDSTKLLLHIGIQMIKFKPEYNWRRCLP